MNGETIAQAMMFERHKRNHTMVRINREFFNEDIEDEATDLQFNRTRWYDPAVGRWLNEDPVGFWADGANFTSYVAPRQTPTESTVASEKG
jgi:RHS repeat-associated protein